MTLRVRVVRLPETWGEYGRIQLLWQSRVRPPEHTPSPDASWAIDIPIKDGLWSGPSVGRNSDGRRFLYFAWMAEDGRMFRRIKLYQNQVTGDEVTLEGAFPDGSPSCSTARIASEA